MDTSQYMGMFLEESREHLQALNQSLLDLESDTSNLTILDEIFRSAHTIKGMSATMGFTVVAELTHEMENVLDKLRKAEIKANENILQTLFQSVDALEQMIEGIATNSQVDFNISDLVKNLTNVINTKPSIDNEACACKVKEQIEVNDVESNLINEACRTGYKTYEIKINLNPECLLKSARAYLVVNALEEYGDIIKTIPTTEDIEKELFEHEFSVLIITTADEEKIRNVVLSISEVDNVCIYTFDNQNKAIDDKQAYPATLQEQQDKNLKSSKTEGNNNNNNMHEKKIKTGQSVRVDIEKLDTLLNLVGELVINKTRLEQIGNSNKIYELNETIEQMDRVTSDLQSVVMKVRMVPVGQVFNRFPRMIRDLARELQKEVDLSIEGEETELDRTVIDEIGDPLVHLLRNAIDHGIESPEERQKLGKPLAGHVKLIARHEGNNVIIIVEDDGKGINADIIKQKVIKKGLVSQAEIDKMDANEAVKLVFLPGFSTADAVTDISGRGVGMDVVKTKIESLGGMVDVETKINEGSKFKIRLPLTLAIIQALLINISEEIYAIPLSSIDSTINIKAEDIKTVQGQEVILLRGQIIPIIRLAKVLNVPQKENIAQDNLFVVIVHIGDLKAGIIVDSLIGQQEIVIKSLGKMLAGIKVVAGATILGNGQVALILDVGSLMQ